MRQSEAAILLAKCSAYDRRTVGESDALAWSEGLEDIRLTDALEVVKQHFMRSREMIKIVDIREQVKALREKRLAAAPEPIPPHELLDCPDRYGEWLRAARSKIADGACVEQPVLPQRQMPDLDRTFRSVPGRRRG